VAANEETSQFAGRGSRGDQISSLAERWISVPPRTGHVSDSDVVQELSPP